MRIRAADYRAMAWKNGQGMTREIAREPGEGDFLWRLSIAEVATSGDFSLFPGYDRTITLIEGAGMRLAFEAAPEKAILRRFEPFDFSGDWHCHCSLAAGPVRDFNLMVDRERARGKTEALRLDGRPVERSVDSGWLLIYCAEGALSAGGFAAGAGDTIRLESGPHEIVGGNAIALVMSVHMLRGR
ncbi:MAG TPA: HutD family protein [Verrucomicrobiae bacterium]|nr:HutD family protein [Verrucomicrobiae bacterium]